MPRNDPSENGGLFIGRRPGTGPIRWRQRPPQDSPARQRVDRFLALLVMGIMFLVALSFWGPVPLLGLWLGSHIQYWTDSPATGLLAAFLVCLGGIFLGLWVNQKLDRAWILLRRAGGIEQKTGVAARVFGATCLVGVVVFSVWLLLFSGASLAPVGIRF